MGEQQKHGNSRAKNVYLNSGVALVGQILQILAGFLVRSMFVRYLGKNYLGYEAVFSNILQMLNMADLGISVAVTAFLYRPLAEQDNDAITALMYLYKRIYQVIGAVVALFGIGASFFLSVLIPDADCGMWELRCYFFISLAGTVFTYYLAYKRTLLLADQKSYVVMIIDTMVSLAASVCQILILLFVPGYAWYLLTVTARNLISNTIITVSCSRLYPNLKKPVKEEIYKTYKSQVLTYVKDLFIAKIGGYIYNSTDNLIISVFRGSVLAGCLSNYTMVTQQVCNVVAQILSSVQGTYGNFISETKETEEQRKMTDAYLLVNVFIGIFCMLCVMFLIQPFVRIFFGKQYLLEDVTVFWLSVNLMLTIVLQLPTQIFTIYRLYHYDRPIIIVSAFLNITVSALLVQKMGIDGVLIGTFITSLIYLFSRFYIIGKLVYKVPCRYYVMTVLKYFSFAAASMLTLYAVTSHAQTNTLWSAAVKIVFVGILAAALPLCFLVTTEEWQFIADVMLPEKLRKICSKRTVWCATAGIIVAVVLWGNGIGVTTQASEGSKSLERKKIYAKEQAEAQTGVFHLSFDDVIEVFRDLTENEEVYDSIFENELLGWLKELHDKYGVNVSCYVYYQDEGFCLDDCTMKFQSEFKQNMDWLRFGFHSFDPETMYGADGNSDILEDYSKTVTCLKKVVGGGTNVIRLHGYRASYSEVLDIMSDKQLPVTGLFCADDSRRSYYLDETESAYIYCHDEYTDEENGLRFIATDLRIEYIENVDKKIKEFQTDAWNNQLNDLVVFTHEWAVDDTIKEKIEKLCAYAEKNGYQFSFFEDLAGN